MDLELLEDFLAVLEHGSILAAAEATGASQPTLSRRIRELEDALGVLLLNRSSKGIRPTVYGEQLKLHAQRMLAERRTLLDDLRALKSGSHGHVRVGMAPAFSGYLPEAINALRAEKAGATFEVVGGTYDALVKRTLGGEIEGAFTLLPAGESVESLAVRVLGEEQIIVVADAEHPLHEQPEVTATALKEASWIAMNRPRSILDAFRELAITHGMEEPDIVVETSSLDFLKSMLKGSALLAALPNGAVAAELSDGRLKSLPVGDLPKVQVGFVHQHGVLPPLLTQLLQRIEVRLKTLC